MDNSPLIALRGVSKRYGAHTVLDRLDLTVARHEKVAIIGPSGSGKSTLLRALMMLEPIDDGQMLLDGRPLSHMPRGAALVPADAAWQNAARRQLGMVFQNFNLFPHMNAWRNVAEAPRRTLGLDRAAARERAVELLEMVGLGAQLEHYPAQLSGGQQQRVAIARALALRPQVLLLDEITSALDPELCGEVLQVIRRLGSEHRLTMLMVTHQMGFARAFADRVCFFSDGRISEQGTPQQLFGAPREARTRAFLSAVADAL